MLRRNQLDDGIGDTFVLGPLGMKCAGICVDGETKQILRPAILGVGGDEVIHVLLDVMYAKAPYSVIQCAMHIQPKVAEYLPVILGKLEPYT